jgi:hypothetical protein
MMCALASIQFNPLRGYALIIADQGFSKMNLAQGQ